MKKQIVYRNLEKPTRKSLKAAFEEQIATLEPLLKDYEEDGVYLRAVIEKHKKRTLFRTAVELYLPRKTLVAHEENENAEVVIRSAFDELRRQLQKHRSLLKNEPLWRRKHRRKQLRTEIKEGPQVREQERRKLYFDLIRAHLPDLYDRANREIAYLQASGDLIEDDLTPDELVDAVVVRGYSRFEDRDTSIEVEQWLYQIMLEVLEEEVKRSREQMERTLPLEEAPALAEEEMEDEEEVEMFQYFEIPETLRLENLIPKPDENAPDREIVKWEQQVTVHRILAMMPRLWRQALVLIDVDGVKEAEACGILGIDTERLHQIRRCAEAFLRQTLMEMGYSGIEEEAVTLEDLMGQFMHTPIPESFSREMESKFTSTEEK